MESLAQGQLSTRARFQRDEGLLLLAQICFLHTELLLLPRATHSQDAEMKVSRAKPGGRGVALPQRPCTRAALRDVAAAVARARLSSGSTARSRSHRPPRILPPGGEAAAGAGEAGRARSLPLWGPQAPHAGERRERGAPGTHGPRPASGGSRGGAPIARAALYTAGSERLPRPLPRPAPPPPLPFPLGPARSPLAARRALPPLNAHFGWGEETT